MFTPKRVIYPSSDNLSEILIVCEDSSGKIRNVTVIDDTLGAQLATTPPTVPNPAFAPLVDAALSKAAEILSTPDTPVPEDPQS